MAAQLLQFKIKAQDQASPKLKEVKKNLRDVSNETKKTSLSMQNFGADAVAAAAAIAGLTLAIRKGIREFFEYERSVKRLEGNLGLMGVTSTAALRHFQAFSSAVQQNTVISETAANEMQALFLAMGATSGQLENAVLAVADMAAATGKTTDEVARQLAKTLGGYAGELGEIIPQLKEFTVEQLQAGAAIELIGEKFRGSAKRELETAAGQFTQLKNILSDFLRYVGQNLLSWLDATGKGFGIVKSALQEFNVLIGGSTRQILEQQLKVFVALRGAIEAIPESLGKFLFGSGQLADWKNNLTQAIMETTINVNELTKAEEQAAKKAAVVTQAFRDQQLAAKGLTTYLDDMNETEQDRLKTNKELERLMREMAKHTDKQIDKMKELENLQLGMSQSFIGGDIQGAFLQGNAAIVGGAENAAPQLAVLSAILLSARELPGRIEGMLNDLAASIGEGIPRLIVYLGTQFIPSLIQGLAQAISGLLDPSNLLDMVTAGGRATAAIITGGLSEIGLAIADFFSSPSPQEKWEQVMAQLAGVFASIQEKLTAAADAIRLSFMDLAEQSAFTQNKMNDLAEKEAALVELYSAAALDADEERAGELAMAIADLREQQIRKAQELYNIESARIDEAIAKEKELTDQAIANFQAQQQQLELQKQSAQSLIATYLSLQGAAVGALSAARQSVLSATLSPSANVAQLQAAFDAANDPQAKSAAAQALAGGLQQQFQALQNMAAQGLISNEEFQLRQADIVAQLQAAEEATKSEFEQLIAEQQKIVDAADMQIGQLDQQIALLEEGFNNFVSQMEAQRDALQQQTIAIVNELQNINATLQGTPSFQGGGSVDRTGLAFLHAGETVVPKGGSQMTLNINVGGGGMDAGQEKRLIAALRSMFRNNTGDIKTFMRGQLVG